jgi:3-phenylpropionate/trans-cinnamate dioxygenase ferredoxin reductase component
LRGAAHYGATVADERGPWFWSNQYDLRLQTIGLSQGHTSTLMRGDPATRTFSVIYLKDNRVIALDCVNAPKDFMQGKALIAGRYKYATHQLADTNVALKDVQAAST